MLQMALEYIYQQIKLKFCISYFDLSLRKYKKNILSVQLILFGCLENKNFQNSVAAFPVFLEEKMRMGNVQFMLG